MKMQVALASTGLVAAVAAAQGPAIQTDDFGHVAVAPIAGAGGAPDHGGTAGAPDWMPIGPFGGDADDVAASPADPNVVLAGIAPSSGSGGGLYRSTDAGNTWSLVPALDGVSVYDIEFAPDGTAYIGTADSVWKSLDDGVSWSHLALGIGANDTVLEVAIDPSNAMTVWAGIAEAFGGQPVNLMRSINGGATWVNRSPPLASPMSGKGIAIDPGNSDRVFACFAGAFGGGQVWFSTTGGTTWVNRSAGLPANPMNDIKYDGARVLVAGGQLFGSQFVGLYQSLNNGLNWQPLHDGTWPLRVVNQIDIDPGDRSVILAATAGAGVNRSVDGGATWQIGIGGSESMALLSVRYSPGSSSVVYLGASSAGVVKSADGGDNFEVSSTGIGALNVTSIDAGTTEVQELAIAFSGLNDGGVQTSLDGGQTWTLQPVPPTRYNEVRYAPDGTLYAISDGPSSIAPEGVYRRNGDGTWTGLGPDQGNFFESELMVLQFSSNDADLILAGGADFGNAGFEATIWRSPDAGATWLKAYEGSLDFEEVTDIEIVQDGTDTVMLACYNELNSPSEGGALRSTDGGFNWSDSSAGLPAVFQGRDLCASPADAQTYFMANSDFTTGGLFKTTDGGQTWASAGFAQSQTYRVVCDPGDDQVLYIGKTDPQRVLRSEDGGATASPFNAGLSVAGATRDLQYAAGSPPRLLYASSTGAWTRELSQECLTVLNETVVCSPDGQSFAYDVEALNACTGDTQMFSFSGSTGATGEDFCFSILVTGDQGEFCCSTQLCVQIPECTPGDLDGNGGVSVSDLLALLISWGPCDHCGACPADIDGNCSVGVEDLLIVLANWD